MSWKWAVTQPDINWKKHLCHQYCCLSLAHGQILTCIMPLFLILWDDVKDISVWLQQGNRE